MLISAVSCLLWCKDTNFNAIHNAKSAGRFDDRAVYYGAKILILMQFTTAVDKDDELQRLFIMVQRY